MNTITITEALAEIKTIGARIKKKEQYIASYLLRQEKVKDPLSAETGGSVGAIKASRQAITDLNRRLIQLRAKIQASNTITMVTVNGMTQSVGDWLTWRKEVAPGEKKMLETLRLNIEAVRQQQKKQGIAVLVGGSAVEAKPEDIIVNVDEGQLAKDIENLEETLGVLDGRLSLNNATRTINID